MDTALIIYIVKYRPWSLQKQREKDRLNSTALTSLDTQPMECVLVMWREAWEQGYRGHAWEGEECGNFMLHIRCELRHQGRMELGTFKGVSLGQGVGVGK